MGCRTHAPAPRFSLALRKQTFWPASPAAHRPPRCCCPQRPAPPPDPLSCPAPVFGVPCSVGQVGARSGRQAGSGQHPVCSSGLRKPHANRQERSMRCTQAHGCRQGIPMHAVRVQATHPPLLLQPDDRPLHLWVCNRRRRRLHLLLLLCCALAPHPRLLEPLQLLHAHTAARGSGRPREMGENSQIAATFSCCVSSTQEDAARRRGLHPTSQGGNCMATGADSSQPLKIPPLQGTPGRLATQLANGSSEVLTQLTTAQSPPCPGAPPPQPPPRAPARRQQRWTPPPLAS